MLDGFDFETSRLFFTDLMRSYRALILDNFGKIDFEAKTDKTVVTEIDKKIEKIIRQKIKTEYPKIGINGEEFGKEGDENNYFLIDPIDGTDNFVRGIPQVGSIIGLVVNGQLKGAYIYDPFNDVIFSAYQGLGAYRNNQKLEIKYLNNCPLIDLDVVAMPEKLALVMPILRATNPTIITLAGSANRAIWMANNQLEIAVKLLARGKDWDYGPVALLYTEAGGKFIALDGLDMLKSRSFILYNPYFENTIQKIVDHLKV